MATRATHAALLFGLASALLAVFTVYAQLRELNHISALRTAAIGLKPAWHFMQAEQVERHQAILDKRAGDPWQYRVLPAALVEAVHRATPTVPLTRWFVLLRWAQNTCIFLAFSYLLAGLGLSTRFQLAGLMALAWSLALSGYNAGLAFDTYFDLLFYLLAAGWLLRGRYGPVIPLALLAAANRETSLLLPLLMAVTPGRPIRNRLRVAGLTLAAQFVVLAGLRMTLGPQPLIIPEGHAPGCSLFLYNVARPITWLNLGLAFMLVPLLAAGGWRTVSTPLGRWALALVPIWLAAHFAGAIVAEIRLMLVPYALVVLPTALLALASREPAPSAPGLPAGGRAGSRS